MLFNKNGKHNIGKMAMWRLRFGDCSWVSDYIINYASQHAKESYHDADFYKYGIDGPRDDDHSDDEGY
jgi:hypothetical protein